MSLKSIYIAIIGSIFVTIITITIISFRFSEKNTVPNDIINTVQPYDAEIPK